jgi:GTP-binding protein
LKVPIGTTVRSDDGVIEADLILDGQRIVVAQGGKGGLGNMHFKSSTNQAPRQSTPGEPGEEREIFLELKLISHIGFVGFPNAGKSTLLRSLSSATPKVGDYPFTTLAPHLGVLEGDPPITLADIPGIIEDAHRGAGLGIQFLKHISRSAYLMFVLSFEHDRSLERTYGLLLQELKEYDPKLLSRPRMVVINKSDLLDSDTIEESQREVWKAEWASFKSKTAISTLISAKQQMGLERLISLIREEVLKPARAMVS